MRKLIYIIIISFTIHSCEFRTFPATSEEEKLFQLLFVLNMYLYINVCPPKDATLDSGTHTITLNEGEEYWFDISTDSEPYSTYLNSYEVGIVEISGQVLSIGNPSCMRNGQFFDPSIAKAEGYESSIYKDGFWIYVLSFRNNKLAGIKSTSGSGEIRIKVP